MGVQTEVVNEIKKVCGNCIRLPTKGWHFVYEERHMFYIPKRGDSLIRFSIPHLVNAANYDRQNVIRALNETNREVKFIKVVVLKNDSISISYDHRYSDYENIGVLVKHMIKTLDFASNYILQKLEAS